MLSVRDQKEIKREQVHGTFDRPAAQTTQDLLERHRESEPITPCKRDAQGFVLANTTNTFFSHHTAPASLSESSLSGISSGNGTCSSRTEEPATPDLPLSDEQEMVRREVLSGKSCFLTGCGGTGKSFLTGRLIAELKQKLGPGGVAVTATTGIAACHIRGVSLHSFAGIGLGEGSSRDLLAKVQKNHRVVERWRQVKCLVIDEVSMLDGALFEKLDDIARKVRQTEKPFGGVQLLLVGDFAQLPPVSKTGNVYFCFETRCWTEAIQLQVELKRVFRQSNVEFVNMLRSIRLGVCTQEIVDKLNGTRFNHLNESSGVKATRLFCKNMDVEALNMGRVTELSGKMLSLTSYDAGESPYREALDKSCLAPSTLYLKPGAQVMLLKNLEFESGLTNGTRGVFEEVVQFEEREGPETLLRVRFETNRGEVCHLIRRQVFSMEVSGRVVASRTQYPLKLAYAITIHKCQGMTLSKAELSLGGVFEYGQAYVALSRVTDLAGLRLLDFSPALVKCHPRVLEFYNDAQQWARPATHRPPPTPPPALVSAPAGKDSAHARYPARSLSAGEGRQPGGGAEEVVITKVTRVSDPVAFVDLDSDAERGKQNSVVAASDHSWPSNRQLPAEKEPRVVIPGHHQLRAATSECAAAVPRPSQSQQGGQEEGNNVIEEEMISEEELLAIECAMSQCAGASAGPSQADPPPPCATQSSSSSYGKPAFPSSSQSAFAQQRPAPRAHPPAEPAQPPTDRAHPPLERARQPAGHAFCRREPQGKEAPPSVGEGGGVTHEEAGGEELVCFTDGACRGNGRPGALAGFAVVWPHLPELDCAGRLGPDEAHTNNRAEYRAAVRALQQADAVDPGRLRPLRVYTDSMLLVNTVTLWMGAWHRRGWTRREGGLVSNLDLVKALWELTTARRVTWTHVRAHTDGQDWVSLHNARADAAAAATIR